MKKLIILSLLISPLLVSCPYGIFDLLKPNNSIIIATINGEPIYNQGYDGGVYKIDIDKNPHDYLILTAEHYKDESFRDFPFTWISDTIPIQSIGSASNTIGIGITNKLQCGMHTITALSSVCDELSRSFKLYVVSETDTISAEYHINDDFTPVDGVDYTDILYGTVSHSTKQITLVGGGVYLFSITSPKDTNISNYTFSCNNNINKDGDTVIYWSYDNGEYSLVVSSDKNDSNLTPTATITHTLSGLSLSFLIDIKRIIKTDITETETDVKKENFISLNINDGPKSYNINLNNGLPPSTVIYACLPTADDIKKQDEEIMNSNEILWSDMHVFNAYYKNDTVPITYFSLNFNGHDRTITVTPYINTVNRYNKNIDFYLYLKEDNGEFLGKWKVTIGGVIEKIETDKQQISEKVNSSGSINATIYPENASGSIIWYLSETPYKTIILDKKTVQKAPEATQNPFLNNLVYMIGEETNNGSKKSVPLMSNNTSKLLFSSGGTNGKVYLIALAENTNDEVFKSIPVVISANGEISIRSTTGVYASAQDSSGKIIELDKYTDENKNLLKLPDRAVQEYPDTAENGKYGPSVRTFYFPHNKESSIIISCVPTTEKLKWNSLPYKNELADIREIQDGAKMRLIITPFWYTHTKNALQNSSMTIPPQNKHDNSKENQAAYQIFTDYLGITYIDLSTDYNQSEILCRIRIIIYDATVYSQ